MSKEETFSDSRLKINDGDPFKYFSYAWNHQQKKIDSVTAERDDNKRKFKKADRLLIEFEKKLKIAVEALEEFQYEWTRSGAVNSAKEALEKIKGME